MRLRRQMGGRLKMHIREYQTWLQAYDEARGWDKIVSGPHASCT